MGVSAQRDLVAMQGTTPPTGQTPTGVVRIDATAPFGPVSPGALGSAGIEPKPFPPELQARVARIRQVQGRFLCRRSPVVALKAAALAGGGAFVAGAAVGWFVLHTMPSLVTSTDQRVVFSLVGGVFALTVATGTAGYATARWWHARTIPSKGRVRATGVGLVLALVVAGGAVAALQPWSFPPAHVVVVSPLVVGEYLAQHEVTGGLMVYGEDNTAVAYLHTTLGKWIEAAIPPSAIATVYQEIPVSPRVTYTQGGIARGIGGGQQDALRNGTEWLWLMVGVMGAWTVACAVAQRRRWRHAPWPAPVTDDTLQAIERAHVRSSLNYPQRFASSSRIFD